jgi:sugar/nucleoside kinase (ribokinase family)
MSPDVLVVGHIVKDITSDGWRLGGGAHYAAIQFRRLGMSVGVVTAYGPDIEHADVPGVEWHALRSLESTIFENVYTDGRREQRVSGRAGSIGFDDLPPQWRDAPIVFLAPVLDEIDADLPAQIGGRETLVALGAQGWLRRVMDGRVEPGDVESTPAWLDGQLVFVSEEDVTEPEAVAQWQDQVRLVILTRGRAGYTIWSGDGSISHAGPLAFEVDPTGAGDVFAAAFVYRYARGADAEEAGRFAHAAASLAVQAEGVEGIGDRAAVEAQMRREAAVGAG